MTTSSNVKRNVLTEEEHNIWDRIVRDFWDLARNKQVFVAIHKCERHKNPAASPGNARINLNWKRGNKELWRRLREHEEISMAEINNFNIYKAESLNKQSSWEQTLKSRGGIKFLKRQNKHLLEQWPKLSSEEKSGIARNLAKMTWIEGREPKGELKRLSTKAVAEGFLRRNTIKAAKNRWCQAKSIFVNEIPLGEADGFLDHLDGDEADVNISHDRAGVN